MSALMFGFVPPLAPRARGSPSPRRFRGAFSPSPLEGSSWLWLRLWLRRRLRQCSPREPSVGTACGSCELLVLTPSTQREPSVPASCVVIVFGLLTLCPS